MEMPQGLGGTATITKGVLGRRVEDRDWYQSWQRVGQGPGLSPAPLGFHTWEQKLILFGTAAWSHTHKQGLEGLHLLPKAWERRLARDSASLKAPVEHGRSRGGRLELTNIPMAARGAGDGSTGSPDTS